MRKQCKRNERQANPPQIQQNSCSVMNGETLCNFTALYSFIPLCWAEVVGIFTPFHRQESKGQVVQQGQKKAPPFHPSALTSIEETGLFLFQIWQQTFIIFLCFPKLLLSKKLCWGCTETKKEAIPSSGSIQWNPPIPPAILHRPHKPTQDFKDELKTQLFPTTTSGPWSPFHPAPKRNQMQIHGKQCRNTETTR